MLNGTRQVLRRATKAASATAKGDMPADIDEAGARGGGAELDESDDDDVDEATKCVLCLNVRRHTTSTPCGALLRDDAVHGVRGTLFVFR